MTSFRTVGEISNEMVKRIIPKKAIEEILQALGINDQIIIPTSCKLDRRKNHHE